MAAIIGHKSLFFNTETWFLSFLGTVLTLTWHVCHRKCSVLLISLVLISYLHAMKRGWDVYDWQLFASTLSWRAAAVLCLQDGSGGWHSILRHHLPITTARLWLQMTSNSQDGSSRHLGYFGFTSVHLWAQVSGDVVVHLYIQSMGHT